MWVFLDNGVLFQTTPLNEQRDTLAQGFLGLSTRSVIVKMNRLVRL